MFSRENANFEFRIHDKNKTNTNGNGGRPNPIVVIMPIGFQSSAVLAAVALARVVSVVASVAVTASVDDSVAASPATDFVAVSTPSATEVDAGSFGVIFASVEDVKLPANFD